MGCDCCVHATWVSALTAHNDEEFQTYQAHKFAEEFARLLFDRRLADSRGRRCESRLVSLGRKTGGLDSAVGVATECDLTLGTVCESVIIRNQAENIPPFCR